MNVPVSFMGIVSMIISGGTIISSLFSDKFTRKLGTRIVTVISVFLTAIALFGFSTSNQFWKIIVFAIPYGLATGAIDAALNNYVAIYYSSKHMSWLHCFWGVGTIVSPFVMSYALTNSSWYNGYRIVAFIQFGIGLLLLAMLPAWKINSEKIEVNASGIGLIGSLKIKGVPFLFNWIFRLLCSRKTVMYWSSTYFAEVKGIATEQAALGLLLFFI